MHVTHISLSNSATYNTHLDCQLVTIVEECPRWWPWTAVWSGDGNKAMRIQQQDIDVFLPWGHGPRSRAKVIASPLWQQPNPFPSHHVPRRSLHSGTQHVCCHQPTHLVFHITTPRPLMAKPTEDCLAQKCWRKGHYLQPFGHPCQVDSLSLTFLHGQSYILLPNWQDKMSFSSGWDRVDNGFLTQWPQNAKLYTVYNHCSTAPLQTNYTEYPESHFTNSEVLNCYYFH